MTRRLRLTTAARADLDEIFAFMAARNPTAARRYVTGLREQCDTYRATPFLGHQEPEIAARLGESPEHVRSFLYRNHRCYYIMTNEEIRVLGFMHTSRDRDTVLEERFPG